jgi:Glycosyl hydrolase family 76
MTQCSTHLREPQASLRDLLLFLRGVGRHLPTSRVRLGALLVFVGAVGYSPLHAPAALAASLYPAGASRPAIGVRSSELAHQAKSSRSTRPAHSRKKVRKPPLHGNPARALVAFEAMQQYYYIPGSGLYTGEPFSFLWPFSQALAATVSMANIPGINAPGITVSFKRELHWRLIGLSSYLDTTNSGAPEGTFTSSLAAFDGTVAPPAGPGGPKYYDDNDWVGIELARLYKMTHNVSDLGSAEGIMAFEMAGWDANPELACPGGVPFSNDAENTERNTVTNAPAAELGVALYQITGNLQYLQFAEMAYEWVRRCLLQPSGMYADHIGPHGTVEPMQWSYNQGSMIGAGTLLYQATGNGAYLYEARQTAKAALAYFTPERLESEPPFFVSVYFRNLLYLDSVTHDPPGPAIAQAYVNNAWQHLRLGEYLFVSGSPPASNLLVQAAIVQIYALLSSPPGTFF